VNDAQAMKVFVLGDEHALMIARQLPDSLIRRTAGAKRSKVKGVRDDIVQQCDELLGELFIEEQAHRSSGGNRVRSALAFRSVSETRPHILARQLRKIQEDLILRHPSGEVTEHVANADARATDAGLPKPDLWIDADPIEQAHAEAVYGSSRTIANPSNANVLGRQATGKLSAFRYFFRGSPPRVEQLGCTMLPSGRNRSAAGLLAA
jgi:hypothetical protein